MVMSGEGEFSLYSTDTDDQVISVYLSDSDYYTESTETPGYLLFSLSRFFNRISMGY